MLEMNVKEVRSSLYTILNKVEQGEEIIILRRGKRIARLSPPEILPNKLPSLKSFRESIKIQGKSLSKTVSELRDEERF